MKRNAVLATGALLALSIGIQTHAFCPLNGGKIKGGVLHHARAHISKGPVRATPGGGDYDIADQAVDTFARLATGLNRELPVPTFLVPPRPNELGQRTTVLRGWYSLATGLSFAFGNIAFPVLFWAFLQVSRPADVPDLAPAIAALLTSSLLSPVFEWVGENLDLSDSFVGRVPLLVGLSISLLTFYTLLTESREAFYAPEKEFRERKPTLKSERDLRFFDVKVKTRPDKDGKADAKGSNGFTAEVEEKK